MMNLTRRSVLLGATALTAAGVIPLKASAQNNRTYHALLVAVTEYPTLPEKNWLIGPNHDALLVREYLQFNPLVKFDPANITLLADGIDGANGSPTHEGITKALQDIAAKVKRDDFVYLHLSGHGAQQVAFEEGDEADGLDEIFLPRDIGKWAGGRSSVPNAFVDNEMKVALDAIRGNGAFVWIVFDCCHSGSATRALAPIGDEQVRERKVEFTDLCDESLKEEAEKALQKAASNTNSRGIGEEGERQVAFPLKAGKSAESIKMGGLVAFYAAQTIETTPEMPLPKDNPDATRYGLFTYTIFSKLAKKPFISYRQLGHAVLQQYAADGRTRPTPLFEGDLDARVFDTQTVENEMQWKLDVADGKATIAAGALHRLSVGTKLAILPEPISEMSEAVGYVEITQAKNLVSTVKPVEFDGKPALKIDDIPANAYARIAEMAVTFELLVARPAPADGLDAELAFVNTTLDAVNAAKDKKFRMRLVEPGAAADVRLAIARENAVGAADPSATDAPALFFLPESGDISLQDGSKPPLVAINMATPEKLATGTNDNLTKIFRATSLSRLAADAEEKIDRVNVVFSIKREDVDAMEPMQASAVPRVRPGDQIHVHVKNETKKLFDMNILYIGSDYSITHIDAQRLESNAEVQEGLLQFSDSTFGMERMIAVLTEAPPLSEIEDLKFLEQGGVPAATRSATGPEGFSDMLRDIGFAQSTRSVVKLGDKGGAKGAVMIFPMETVKLDG